MLFQASWEESQWTSSRSCSSSFCSGRRSDSSLSAIGCKDSASDGIPSHWRRRLGGAPVLPLRRLARAGGVLMTANGIAQCVFFLVVLIALAKPLGTFMAQVYEGERTFLHPVLGPVERVIYRLTGTDPEEGMTWKTYALA